MTITQTIQPRPVTADELPALAHVLARAFADDPVTAWLFPDDASRLEGIGRFFSDLYVPRIALGRDEFYADDDLRGVADWTPPGMGHMSALDSLRLLPRMAVLFGGRLPRALKVLSYMESQFPKRPHWHLTFLGTAPEYQGQGIGSALMRQMLDRFDREGTPAYLEASTTRSRALYLRHGFVVMNEMRLPDGGPPLWRMWREPQA
jgi:ribosomal protein S18 acetylase RimI-like enzyme